MLLYIEGTKIRNKTKCTPNFKMQWEPVISLKSPVLHFMGAGSILSLLL